MPEIALDRRRIVVTGVVVLLAFVLAGKFLLRPAKPAAVAPPLRVAPTATSQLSSATLYVDVVGAVRRPGLYRLRERSRARAARRPRRRSSSSISPPGLQTESRSSCRDGGWPAQARRCRAAARPR